MIKPLLTLTLAATVAGCATHSAQLPDSNAGRNAVLGAGIGALIGALDDGTEGAVKGAIIGGVGGGVIGSVQDQMDAKVRDAYKQGIDDGTVRVQRDAQDRVQITFTDAVLFDLDSDRVKPGYFPALNQLAQALNTTPGARLLIVGHTDASGSEAYNQDLSVRRAVNVANYLYQFGGVAGGRVQAEGRGETQPVASNETDAGRAENRRIEVVVLDA